MPRVPLLLLHVALTKDITAKITDIVDYSERKIPPETGVSDKTTAMFYSITSTQRGLQVRNVCTGLKTGFKNILTSFMQYFVIKLEK